MVLGTPTTGIPYSKSCCAMLNEPSPPIETSANKPRASIPIFTPSSNSFGSARRSPWPTLAENFPRLDVPRIVPPRGNNPLSLWESSGIVCCGLSKPSYPPRTPMHSHPRFAAVFATARITAFKPGQSPPPVSTPIRLLMWLLYRLRGQPGGAVFADQREAFIYRVYAMRYGEVDLAGKFVAFLKHRLSSPINKPGPHFADEDERRVVKFA